MVVRSLSAIAVLSGFALPLAAQAVDQPDPGQVVARFSVAGPNPDIPDSARAPHGLALQFKLPNDELQQTAMLNVPIFPVSTVQDFYGDLHRCHLSQPFGL